MTYLLYFTFGPVQGFISQARKTSDLYAGSKILSELALNALNTAISHVGQCNIMFPNLENLSYPNRLVIRVESADEAQVQEIGLKICRTVQIQWQLTAETLLTDSCLPFPLSFREAFDNQIANLLELFWVAVPLSGAYDTTTYLNLVTAINARKNVRIIDSYGPAEEGRKCSVDGERNALFYKGAAPSGLLTFNPINPTIQIRQHDYSFAEGEALSAVSFVKRKYGKRDTQSFPSTARIALMHLLGEMEKDERVVAYKKKFPQFDEQLFYEENLEINYLSKYAHTVFTVPADARQLIDGLRQRLKDISMWTKLV